MINFLCLITVVTFMRCFQGIKTVVDVYGILNDVRIITLAPEIEGAIEVIPKLVQQGITVSLGKQLSF